MERGEAGGGGEEEGRAATEVITRVMVAICGIRFTSFKYFFTSINAHVPDKYQMSEDDTQIVSSSDDKI